MISSVAYRLRLPEALGRLHDVFHASLLKAHHGPVPPRADPIVLDTSAAEPQYEFESILHSR